MRIHAGPDPQHRNMEHVVQVFIIFREACFLWFLKAPYCPDVYVRRVNQLPGSHTVSLPPQNLPLPNFHQLIHTHTSPENNNLGLRLAIAFGRRYTPFAPFCKTILRNVASPMKIHVIGLLNSLFILSGRNKNTSFCAVFQKNAIFSRRKTVNRVRYA